MQSNNDHVFTFGVHFNFATDSVFVQKNDMNTTVIGDALFELLDGTPMLLLDGTNMLLLEST